jgi:hypothetical protein
MIKTHTVKYEIEKRRAPKFWSSFFGMKKESLGIKKNISSMLTSLPINKEEELQTAKTVYRKFETNIPRNETARPQSQFLRVHSCFCARFIFPRSICLFCCRKIGGPIMGMWKHECGNRD